MRRRKFITLLGGAAAAWPLVALAQQPERVRRIGVLMSTGADDPEGQARIAAFLGGLQQLGWTDGRNVQIDIAPGVTRVLVLRHPADPAGTGQFSAVQTAAPSLSIEARPVNVHDPGEIERAITAFARSGNGGLIVTGSGLAALHRHVLISLAAQHKLPAVYFERKKMRRWNSAIPPHHGRACLANL